MYFTVSVLEFITCCENMAESSKCRFNLFKHTSSVSSTVENEVCVYLARCGLILPAVTPTLVKCRLVTNSEKDEEGMTMSVSPPETPFLLWGLSPCFTV